MRPRCVIGLAVVAAACGPAAPRVAPRRYDPPDPVVTARVAPAWDSGEFDLTLKGASAGTETFSIVQRASGYSLSTSTMLGAAGHGRLIETDLETDIDWRPISASVRDVKDGVTIAKLTGTPLRLAVTVGGVAAPEVTAGAAVELFIADNTMIHYAPLCTITGPTLRTAFPGMKVTIAADVAARYPGVVRRDLDLGGASRVQIYCEDERLVAVHVPLAGFTAIRRGYIGGLDDERPRVRVLPPVPIGLTELTRTVAVKAGRHGEAASLACTLVVPSTHATWTRRDRKRAVPAVVLLSGSGAQDRDEDTVGPGGIKMASFRVLAHALGVAGIASIRCDDRGTAKSTGDFGTATLDTFVGDAAATIAALRKEPAIDPRRIGVVGHSEGGVIAPLLATRDRRLAAIALLAAPGRPLDIVLLEQVARSLRRSGATDADRAAALARYRTVFAAIAAGTALPDTSEAREWSGGEAWLRSHLRHDPAVTVRKLATIPVLIIQGGVDQQVSVADAEALEDALRQAGNPNITYRFYRGLNHMLAQSTTGDISEYADPDAVVDPTVVTELVTFLTAL